MLTDRVSAFIRGEPGETFDQLALALCRLGCERNPLWRKLCDERGVRPAAVPDWREIPPLPMAGPDGPAAPELDSRPLAAVVDHSPAAAWLREMGGPPVLSLVPADENPADPVATFTAARLLAGRAADDSVAMGSRGVEPARVRGFLSARQRDRRPALILATPATLGRLLEGLERRGLRFRLPPDSRVVVLGGDGQDGRPPFGPLTEALAVPATALLRERSLAGLLSRLHTGHDEMGEPRPWQTPPWVRARVLDPATLAESADGTEGRLAVLDLATLGSPAYRLTGDRAVAAAEGGLRLPGGTAGQR